MSIPTVWLPGPVAMIPSNTALQRLGGDLPDPVSLAGELIRLCRESGLPARLDERSNDKLVVYTDRCVVMLGIIKGLTPAYRIIMAAPKSFRDHERLVAGVMLIRSQHPWYVFNDVKDLRPFALERRITFGTYWSQLSATWHTVSAQAQGNVMPQRYTEHLELLTEVIEACRDIDAAKTRNADPMQYRRHSPTREQRHNTKGVYDFTLLATPRLQPKTLLYLAERPELRGRVVQVNGKVVTLRFESTVDYQTLPPQGELRELPSDRVYRAQQDAVDTLRRQRSVNPHLLSVLVDNVYQPYRPAVEAAQGLDTGQQRAYQRALEVPDLSLIWGPPGTGKTFTIAAIATAHAGRGKRVLITSHTHRAVDNLLKELPGHLRRVRIGHEESIGGQAQGLRADVQAEAIQKQILASTEGAAQRLATIATDATRWLSYLTDNLSAAKTAEDAIKTHEAARQRATERVMAPLQPGIDAANAALGRINADIAATESRQRGVQRMNEWISRRSGVAQVLVRGLTAPLQRRTASWAQRLADLKQARIRAQSELDTAEGAGRLRVTEDPEVQRAGSELASAEAQRATLWGKLDQASQALQALVLAKARPASLAEWEQRAADLHTALYASQQRAVILSQWRGAVAKVGDELARELVCHADVVAATCVGTATSELLAELEFDIAIVDEAGQISLPNLLVPLVRAKRAVLVGDHAQLPPYLDEEVRSWAAGQHLANSAEVREIVAKSAFERLYDRVPDDRKDMLLVQRRMPSEIAEFVSRTFYRNALRTVHRGSPPDKLFRSPFAMITTSDRPPELRRENKSGGRRETGNQHGYLNELEARLIADLIAGRASSYPDWTVIVPYQAQAALIRTLLANRLGGPVTEQVGTVDSFQGGERSLIVYGFTRSNDDRQIGFLRELRRLNVALSRAKGQLVVVGDAKRLEQAEDREFSSLMAAMVAHVRHSGDLRGSLEFENALHNLAGPPR